MKKLFFGLTFFILLIIGAIYFVLFSTQGNAYIASMIEQKVNEGQTKVSLKVNDFKLTFNDILFEATIDDNSKININGGLNIFAQKVDLKYNINIADLSKLQNITNQKLNGSFSTKGSVVGDHKLTVIKGESNIASSDTTYDVKLVSFEPKNILFNIKGAKIQELLNIVNQPRFADGKINIDGNIKNADIKNLDGAITTNIVDGKVNNTIVNKLYETKLIQPVLFKGNVLTKLIKTQAISKIDFNSSLSNINMKNAIYDLDKGEFLTDYKVDVFDLSKLYDITQTKLRGNAIIEGNVKQSKKLLDIDGKSSLFGGAITFNLLNDDFKAKVDGVEIKDLTHMLYYPEIFTSKSNINLKYNLATKAGKVDGNLLDGQFMKNEYSSLINTFAQFDLTKEVYKKVDVKSDINKEIINTVIDMTSEHTTIKIPASTLNTEKKTIDALIQAKILSYSFDTTVKGDLANPKVDIDKSVFLNTKAGKVVKEKTDEIKNKIEKKIQKKLGDQFKLDQLFNEATKDKRDEELAINKNPTNAEIAEAFKKFFTE